MCRIRNLVTALVAIILSTTVAHADLLRVTPEWLTNNLHHKNLVIIDSRPASDYKVDHIPGAVNLPEALTYQEKSIGGLLNCTFD